MLPATERLAAGEEGPEGKGWGGGARTGTSQCQLHLLSNRSFGEYV